MDPRPEARYTCPRLRAWRDPASRPRPATKAPKLQTVKETLMKYLIMEDFSGQPVPFIFPRRVDHADMRDQLPYGTTLSGGYVELIDGVPHCHGGHAELDVKACPDDADIIAEALRRR